MTILYNSRCNIIRDRVQTDAYGGAEYITGTLIASNEPCRFDSYMPKINTVGYQGIESEKVFSIFFRSTRQHPIPIRENDVIILTFPPVHPELGKKFRVRGVQHESLHFQDPNYIVECTLVRYEESRGPNF